MDKEIRHQVLKAAVRDAAFMREAWQDISPEYFAAREESVIAQVAVAYYQKYGEPIGSMLRTAVESELGKTKWGEEAKSRLAKLLDKLLGFKMEPVSVRALIDTVRDLKKSSFYEKAVDDIIAAYEANELDAEKMAALVEQANNSLGQESVLSYDYFDATAKDRIEEHQAETYREYPLLHIEPLDRQIQIIGPGHLGMVMSPPGGGKGLTMVHIDVAYAIQGLKILHFTLEDPVSLVKKRLDASLSGVPLSKLKRKPKTFRRRFKRAKKAIRGSLRIVDATDGTWSVTKMERVYEQYKREGFLADAVLIDYDDEIICEKQYKGESARRHEFAEIYRRLRRFAKNNNLIVWVAAQTSKQAVGLKVISSKHVAEDYSKIRKVFFGMAIGRDPKRRDIRYINVFKHRLDKQDFGVYVVSNYDAALLYDAEATEALAKELEREE